MVIRRSSGAEALASATVICSGRTGVITQNQMTVRAVFVDGRIMDVEGGGYDPGSGGFPPNAEGDSIDLPLLLTAASMCTNAEVRNTPQGWAVIGDPIEGALIVAAMKGGIDKEELGQTLTRIAELPYDPERKRMSVVFRAPEDEVFVFTKGSFEAVLDACSNVQLHGYVDSLDVGRKRAILAVNQSLAQDSMQSMGFAYRQLADESEDCTVESMERNLVFIGMMGIVDPLRADARASVKKCLAGGIKPIILTDDHVDTAFAFARDLGIATDGSEVLTGEELDLLGEREYSDVAKRFSVYTDILPDQKLRIVRALKEGGETVAVIGREMSDTAVVREADIGISADGTGSSVATNASDIVLMDSGFPAAVDAIEKMRGSHGNARKVIRHFLSGSAAVTVAMMLSLIVSIFWRSFPFPILYIQHVLWINLLAVGIPAAAIALNPLTEDVMNDGPRSRGSILDGGMQGKILIRSILTASLVLAACAFTLGPSALWQINQGRAVTVAFTTMAMSQLAFAFQCRRTPGEGSIRGFFSNRLLLGATFLVIALHLSIIYISPISQIFRTESLSLVDWIPVLAASAIGLLPVDGPSYTRSRAEDDESGGASEDSATADLDTDLLETD